MNLCGLSVLPYLEAGLPIDGTPPSLEQKIATVDDLVAY
jgi:hypothetical protein